MAGHDSRILRLRRAPAAAATGSLAAILLLLASARGDERYFTYSYEPKVLPRDAVEFEQWVTLRAGKEQGVFSAWDLRSELEIGLTDRLTTALYLNFESLHQDDGVVEEDEFEFEGVSSEWKYKLLDPVADPIGLLLYGEVSTNFNELELEQRLVLGKELDRTILAANVLVEEEWEFEREDRETEAESELVVELTAGAAYRFGPRFSLGIEVREVNVFPEMEDLEHAALFAGPAIHFSRERWWATLTILPQVVALKGSTGDSVNLDEFERAEVRLILGIHL